MHNSSILTILVPLQNLGVVEATSRRTLYHQTRVLLRKQQKGSIIERKETALNLNCYLTKSHLRVGNFCPGFTADVSAILLCRRKELINMSLPNYKKCVCSLATLCLFVFNVNVQYSTCRKNVKVRRLLISRGLIAEPTFSFHFANKLSTNVPKAMQIPQATLCLSIE